MSGTTVKDKFENINKAIIILNDKPCFKNAEAVINEILLLIGIDSTNKWVLFNDTQGKIRSNAGFFMQAEGYSDKRAAYKIADDNGKNIDIKTYWLKNTSKANISWIVALIPNFEDEPYYQKLNIGIDFIVPESADKVLIVLSKNYVIRTLELTGELKVTQQEILAKWFQQFDFSNKAQTHEILWTSFDLKPINEHFYEKISNFFTELKQYLSEDIKYLDEKHSSQFVNRLIGRIIFCWFLDKKKVLNPDFKYFDASGVDGTTYYKTKLESLFFKVLNTEIDKREKGIDNKTPFLNGGIFEPKEFDGFEDNKLKFPKDYFIRLYEFFRHYNFTTDESTSTFQQIAIDPEMLGRIFENLLAEQVEETGEQARKSKGAFYTPREIVDFMCKESLREYLRTCLPDDQNREKTLNLLFDIKDHEFRDQARNYRADLKQYKYDIEKVLDEVKIIDPACGSGAFPIGMLHLILAVYERIEPSIDHYRKKMEIIKNSIFGVDIEPMAIEIARLRVWLSIVVDENAKIGKIDPLPNLVFKFVCANSLIKLKNQQVQYTFDDDQKLENKVSEAREQYFIPGDFKIKEELKEQYYEYIKGKRQSTGRVVKSEFNKQLESYDPFRIDITAEFFDSKMMLNVEKYDICIGNPPYVSTKGVKADTKVALMDDYGFADDLYSHFYFKGLELIKDGGVLCYITSKTFWTIQTKKNVRELLLNNDLFFIYDTANPFESVMVDTCVVLVKKNKESNRNIKFLVCEETGKYQNPKHIEVRKTIYENAVNKVFFPPTEFNMKIYNIFNEKVRKLINLWWSLINTSKNISKYQDRLEEYRKELKPGDLTLLGLITDGGQGLATANNGKFVGVLNGTKEAQRIMEARKDKFHRFVVDKKISKYGSSEKAVYKFIESLSEEKIRELFDGLKEKYGRDIFGQGFLYRIVSKNEIKKVDNMTKEEKEDGLTGKEVFVPYDKGDKDGNRWYLRTPYYIDWNKGNVRFLKDNSGKKGVGMPVVRNPQFFFRAGLCWTNVLNPNARMIKCRLKDQSVNDVGSMSLYPLTNISSKYIVSLLNSNLLFDFYRTFINSSVNLQINDFRQIPIIIPNNKQLKEFEDIFDRAYAIKISEFDSKITDKEAEKKLDEIQKELDQKVEELYGIDYKIKA